MILVALRADGSRVVSGFWDCTVRLWNTATGECPGPWRHTIRCLGALSADGSRVVSGSNDKTVRLWNTATGECLRT